MVAKGSKEKLDATKRKALESLQRLEQTLLWLDREPQADDRWGRLDATAKRFEIAFEYVWKTLKAALEYQGVDVYGPRDSIALAGTYQWIDNVEEWAEFLQARNAGVHDYFGLSEEEYAEIARRFLIAANNVLECLPSQ
ncbi:MAG: nucleotidyltransferase substrate binding protein [candidate division KSB1 bacterium]|nr:nucleotidyltransferase substrate binding protein [candidate division KSB1 bacterium]MDZ7304902.1 nucleotidyltransferase substrate binding protein [candidate division KSB1 bacterium]MDZ7313962.1 nucleotidyltransferase substrate binding protein [candidate division KSB1 bacterium]